MNKSSLKIKSNKVLVIILVLFLFFLHYTKIIKPIENYIVLGFDYTLGKISFIETSFSNNYIKQDDQKDVNHLVASLRRENNELVEKISRIKLLEEENEYLRQHLKFENDNSFKQVMVNIVSRNEVFNNSSRNKKITIDKGRNDGLYQGLILVSSHGSVIGKVIDVKDEISQACLLYDKTCKLAVSVQNSDKTSGVIQGEMGLTVKMNLIPQTELIQPGDIIITSGLEENVPRGLVVGRIAEIKSESNELWQSAFLNVLADLENLKFASVVIPK